MKAAALLFSIVCSVASAASEPACPSSLRVGFPDIPLGPFLRGSGPTFEERPGHLAVALKQTMEELGCSYVPVRLPLRRLVSNLSAGRLDMAVGMAATKERQQTIMFPEDGKGNIDNSLAVGEAPIIALVRAADIGRYSNGLPQPLNPDVRVGAVRGSVHEAIAKDLTGTVTDVVDMEKGVLMLRYERIDLLVVPKGMVRPSVLAEAPALVEAEKPLAIHRYFAPVSQLLGKQHPKFVSAFWANLCRQIRSQSGEPGACVPEYVRGLPRQLSRLDGRNETAQR